MNAHDQELPLGRPVMKPPAHGDSILEVRKTAPEEHSDQGRHPADELGRPKQIPLEAHATTAAEWSAIEAAREAETHRMHAQAREQAAFGRFNRTRVWLNTALIVAMLGCAAIAALFVFAQVMQILVMLAFQPPFIKALGYCGVFSLVLIVAAFAFRLAYLFCCLQVNQQVSTAQFKELARRAELRAMVHRDKAEAKRKLEAYLECYLPADGRAKFRAGLVCLDEEAVGKLRSARAFLLDRDRFSDYDTWFSDLKTRFQDELQVTASKVVRDWAMMVGLKTAISPNALLDSGIVLYCSYGMIGDLCRLYNLRMTGPGIIQLLAFTLFNTYLAGEIETHISAASQEIDSYAADLGHAETSSLFDAAQALTGGLGKLVGKKVAGGAANGLLAYKLGHSTIRLLRPMEPE